MDFKETFGIKALLENLDDASPESKLFYIGVDDTLAGTKEMSEKSQNEETVSDYFTMPLADFRKSPLRESNPLKFNKSEKYKLEKVTIDWDTCIKKCNEETLIYIFSNIIDEKMQLNAVEELYKKGWGYHKKMLIWMIKGTSSQDAGAGSISSLKDHLSSERGRSSGSINNNSGGWSFFNLSEWSIMPIPASFPPIKDEDLAKLSEFRDSMS